LEDVSQLWRAAVGSLKRAWRKAIRPAVFKWRQTAPELIVSLVRWYLRYSLSLRDVEELLNERSLEAVWRWVQSYGPELEQRLRRHLKPTNKSWRVDESSRYRVHLGPISGAVLKVATLPAKVGIRRQTFCETTLDPISSVTLGLVTVFDFLA
jgi:hypothetical protein